MEHSYFISIEVLNWDSENYCFRGDYSSEAVYYSGVFPNSTYSCANYLIFWAIFVFFFYYNLYNIFL